MRNAILTYLSHREFAVVGGGASVSVPSDDPLFKHIQLAKFDSARNGDKTTNAPVKSLNKTSITSPPAPPPSCAWDDEQEDETDCALVSGGSGSIIAGVYMPSVNDFIKQTTSVPSMRNTAVAGGWGSSSSSSGNSGTLSTRELLTSGGTGKPVDLPPVPVKNLAKKTQQQKLSGKPDSSKLDSKQKANVNSNISSGIKGRKKARRKVTSKASTMPSCDDIVESSAPLLPVVIEKKDIVKETIKRCSSYYAVISADGKFI